MLQQTIKNPVSFQGVGVHSGRSVICTLLPAPENHGIWFKRCDITSNDSMIPALWDHVVSTSLCTTIGNESGVNVSTVEHIMAALFALNITNLLIEIDGEEMPILDGSALPFYTEIKRAGVTQQNALRHTIRVLKPIKVQHKETWALLEPADDFSLLYTFQLRNSSAIQTFSSTNIQNDFEKRLAPARTFGFLEDIDKLRQAGLARGGSLDNAVVFDGERVLNDSGLRFNDECARHKALDAIGDLYLVGPSLQARFTGHCSGHTLNNILLQTLFRDKSAWFLTTDMPSSHRNLPYRKDLGTGLDARAAS